jgi:beta-glucosidase-like glycosyl hydrolase/CubicO group peptidase (beta-lactamase class C family)
VVSFASTTHAAEGTVRQPVRDSLSSLFPAACLLMPRSGHTPAFRSTVRKNARLRLSPDAESWVKRSLAKMSLEEKLGQLVMLPFHGEFTSLESTEYRELQRAIEQNHVGGFMLSTRVGPFGIERGKPYATAALTNLLQKTARIPLLFAADFERGTAMRLENGTSFPHAMAVAATGRPEDAYTVARITAAEARAVGVHWIFAPVADVNSNPDNPIINVRSFGEDPRRVAAFVQAYVRGVEDNGGLSTAKHFPGHGDTQIDSHLDLPAIPSDRAHLEAVELPPVRAAFTAGASTAMTGHLAVPGLEPDPGRPATLSQKIITGLLRRELGFDGLVVTDALDMGSVARHYTPGEAAVQAILAGADLLLQPPVPDAALAALAEAARSGRLPLQRIDQAAGRVLRAKARVGLHRNRFVDLDSLPKLLARAEFGRSADEIADRGVTLLRHTQRILPLDATRPLKLLLLSIAGDPDAHPGRFLENEIRWRVDSLETLRFDTRFAPISSLDFSRLGAYDAVIVALFVRVADRKGSVALPEQQASAVHRVLASDKPVIVACFGSPYVIKHYPEAKTWLGIFSNADVAQRAAARAIFGQVPISGRIPVNVPGVVCIGAGMDLAANSMQLVPASRPMCAKLSPVFALLDRAIADRACPGGVVAVGHEGERFIHAFGRQTYAADSAKVNEKTIYDTASLTKPVVTVTLSAMLSEAGQLDISAPISRYLPEWACGPDGDRRARVTVAHLLAHAAGLPPRRDYFVKLKGRSEILAHAVAEPLAYDPGAESIYSDIDFILLGAIVERLTGRPLDQLAQERIFVPLGMTSTMFRPPKSLRARIAPTERVSGSRKRVVHGQVHDENASAMGGIAGHAGMFSTGPDLAVFCQMLLNGGIYAHQRILRRQTVAEFTSATPLARNARTLGWNVPTQPSSSGRYFSTQSIGHTGFTGTSIWIDPQKELFVVLLTNANRTHPDPDDDEIRRVQPAIHNSIVECLGLVAGRDR